MSNGIGSLPRYRNGGATEPKSVLPNYGDVSPRRQRKWDEEKGRLSVNPAFQGRLVPPFFSQWARDIAGAQIRDRLGWIPGAETIGNWIGAEDITAEDLTPSEYEAIQETVLRAMQRGNYSGSLDYPDYDFSVTDPEHFTNKIFEKVFGGYDINYDHEGWDDYGIKGNKAEIDKLVEESKGWSGVSHPGSPLATQTAAGKGPAIIPTGTGLIDLSPATYKKWRGTAGLIPRMFDPSAAMMQVLGRMNIIQDPDTGDYHAVDRYNWNHGFNYQHGRNFDFLSRDDRKLLTDSWGEGEEVYDKARVLSDYFGSRSDDTGDPEGSLVRINLGQLDGENNRWVNASRRKAFEEARQEAASQFAAREDDQDGYLAGAVRWLRGLRGGNPTAEPVPQSTLASAGISAEDDPLEVLKRKARDNQQILEAMMGNVPPSVGVGSYDYRQR